MTKIFIDDDIFEMQDDDSWSSLDGSCISNDDTMYSIVGYYRYDENYSREKEKENTIETSTDSKMELKSVIDSFRPEWIENLFDKVVD